MLIENIVIIKYPLQPSDKVERNNQLIIRVLFPERKVLCCCTIKGSLVGADPLSLEYEYIYLNNTYLEFPPIYTQAHTAEYFNNIAFYIENILRNVIASLDDLQKNMA